MCSIANGECAPEESWDVSVGGEGEGSGLMLDGFKRESEEAGPSSGLWPEARAVSQLGSSVIFAQETGGMK